MTTIKVNGKERTSTSSWQSLL